jgi:hypothetical protein
MKEERRRRRDAAPISPCRNFLGDDDICLGQNFRSFFCHQMRKCNEICENLGFILVATVTDFLSARLAQPVTIATNQRKPRFSHISLLSVIWWQKEERILPLRQITSSPQKFARPAPPPFLFHDNTRNKRIK